MPHRYPLKWPDGWPRTTNRASAKFGIRSSSGYSTNSLTVNQALGRLHEEMRRIGITDFESQVVVCTGLRTSGNRIITEQPAAKDPGVAIHWEVPGQPTRVLAIDIYTRTADNSAAVAATLEAMRAIERHGGKVIQERAYAGFDALPPPSTCWQNLGMKPITAATKTSESRNDIIAAHRERVREAAADPLNGGERMATVNAARDEALQIIGERS